MIYVPGSWIGSGGYEHRDHLTLVVSDDMDVEDTSSVRVTVEEYVPPTTNIAGSMWWLVLILIAVIVVAVVVFYKRNQERQWDEWEEV